jgi:signal transduction histidine kinase/ligand-binding sensor domain-containing protein
MKKIILSATCVLMLLPAISFSQQPTVASVHFPGDQTITNIVGMTQDANGFIWIADNNLGLFKYDGNRLKSYKPDVNNRSSIIASRLECVYADSKGNIWTGSFQNGLDRFNPETEIFTHYQRNNSPNSISSDSIRAIIEDNDGTILVGTSNGLDRFDVNTGKFTHIENKSEAGIALKSDHVRTLYKDKAGTIWIGCGSPFNGEKPNATQGGLYKLNSATGEIIHYLHNDNDETSLINNTVRAIFEDSRGVFYVGTAIDGLHIMNREKGNFQRCLQDANNPNKLSRPASTNDYSYADDHITFINEDIQGCIWIGTYSGGINRYNPATKTMEHFGINENEPYKIAKNNFWSCLKTKDNLLWMSTWQPANNDEALMKFSTTSNRLNYSHFGRRAWAFAQDADSSIWFGTNHGLVHKNKNNSYDSFFVDATKTGINNNVYFLEHDVNNNLWVSTPSGLYYFNKTTKSFKSYRHDEKNNNSLGSDVIFATQLDDDKIWVSNLTGLDLMDVKTGVSKHFKYDPADSNTLRSDGVNTIKKDKEGNVWFGTSQGLSQLVKTTGKFNTWERRTAFPSIFEDSRGRIWAGSFYFGLYVYDPNTKIFSQFKDSTGLINDITVFGITEDKEHSLWLNASTGFIQINPETKTASLFGKSWGINTNILTSFGMTSTKGEIIFGDSAGYYHFIPKDFEKNQETLPHPFFTKFFLSSKQIIPGTDKILPASLLQTEKINLGYDQNSFAIEFNSIDFITIESDKNLLYKLENYDDTWRKSNGENKAYYYGVSPGKYVFRVKAVNLYGKWGEKTITIIITPPWYKTWWAYSIYGILFIALSFSVHRYQKERFIKAERARAREIEFAQAKEIEKAYHELKTTQQQLIQSEKMASLGELTAGIAHEIQNPLNFVNNFSEVNSELIAEMKQEIDKGNLDDVKAIANNIDENEQKIIFHGKRADAIVKGMLQHSRSSNGIKEPTDINALCDEYLRLSYHGLRAKDKSFNAIMKTDFDESIGKINVIPQDIGRVILNLITNAFYVVDEKKKQMSTSPEGGQGKTPNLYEPEVSVTTKRLGSTSGDGGRIEIRVADNGNGIPQKILDKIFQPFFTTKPTGQGTGLGLSLSYDIVKAHGGELKVETKESEGSEFIIQLPINT